MWVRTLLEPPLERFKCSVSTLGGSLMRTVRVASVKLEHSEQKYLVTRATEREYRGSADLSAGGKSIAWQPVVARFAARSLATRAPHLFDAWSRSRTSHS